MSDMELHELMFVLLVFLALFFIEFFLANHPLDLESIFILLYTILHRFMVNRFHFISEEPLGF